MKRAVPTWPIIPDANSPLNNEISQHLIKSQSSNLRNHIAIEILSQPMGDRQKSGEETSTSTLESDSTAGTGPLGDGIFPWQFSPCGARSRARTGGGGSISPDRKASGRRSWGDRAPPERTRAELRPHSLVIPNQVFSGFWGKSRYEQKRRTGGLE